MASLSKIDYMKQELTNLNQFKNYKSFIEKSQKYKYTIFFSCVTALLILNASFSVALFFIQSLANHKFIKFLYTVIYTLLILSSFAIIRKDLILLTLFGFLFFSLNNYFELSLIVNILFNLMMVVNSKYIKQFGLYFVWGMFFILSTLLLIIIFKMNLSQITWSLKKKTSKE